MKYKLIASDMDGTLVNDRSELTERTKSTIRKAVAAGVLFVTATGRPLSNVQIVNELFEKDMPFIVFNGAAAYMGKSEKLLFERFLEFDLTKEAFDIGQKLGLAQIVWTGPRLWANRNCEATAIYHGYCKGLDLSITTDLAEIKDEVKGISKVLWIEDPAKVKELSVEMNKHFNGKLKCVSSMPHFLEFISNDAGKGTALEEIGKIFNINKSEMIAIGDSYNDICMLKYAGFGVAMENAPEDIKELCDYVTLSNNNNGVAAVIEEFVL
ncbi:MAG: Cof-type HAD-IIB family hydrolase [Oscillospiraceae bacterium]|nr:Cof-type HAD-IIB family hydrolase [Oscillospiraceae bacterium]